MYNSVKQIIRASHLRDLVSFVVIWLHCQLNYVPQMWSRLLGIVATAGGILTVALGKQGVDR